MMDNRTLPSDETVDLHECIIKKVPGKIPPMPRENSLLTENLKDKSTADLKELLERQERILSNKSLVSKLADKGSKAAELRGRIEKELKSRNDVDVAANLLADMSLSQLNALEWTGHRNPGQISNMSSEMNLVDQEETNPLKIIATHCGTTNLKKQISIVKPQESLIRPEDVFNLDECSSSQETILCDGAKGTPDVKSNQDERTITKLPHPPSIHSKSEPYANFICERFGHKEAKEKFKPNKPLKPFCGTYPLKPSGRMSSKPKQWEETNVTPPAPVYGDTKLLDLEESIELQRDQNQKLKEIQIKHAAERLCTLQGIKMVEQIPATLVASMAYRDHSDSEEEGNEADLEDQEHHDEDQLDRGTTVVYNIES